MSGPRLPGWLANEEPFTPPKDKDAFIDKSILSILGVLSRIRQQGAHREGTFRANAVFKLAFALLAVVLLALSSNMAFVWVALAAMLCRVCLMRAEEIAKILRNGLAAAAFSALVLLPAGLLGNWYSLEIITSKVFVSVSALSILSYGTRWDELTGALKVFFIPDIFIFVLDITVKYIVLLGEFSLNMLWALRLRSVGKNARKHSSLSGIAGSMFLHSREMASEMHAAMECRGFTGEYRRPRSLRLCAGDALLFAGAAAAVAVFMMLK